MTEKPIRSLKELIEDLRKINFYNEYEGCEVARHILDRIEEWRDEAAASYPNVCPGYEQDYHFNGTRELLLCENCYRREKCPIPNYKIEVFGAGGDEKK